MTTTRNDSDRTGSRRDVLDVFVLIVAVASVGAMAGQGYWKGLLLVFCFASICALAAHLGAIRRRHDHGSLGAVRRRNAYVEEHDYAEE